MICSEFCKNNSHSLCNGMSFMLITGPSMQQEKTQQLELKVRSLLPFSYSAIVF